VRTILLAIVLTGCGFSLTTDGGGDDEVPEGRAISIVDDTRDDFAGTHFESTIAERGSIEPDAFVLGGLHARSFMNSFPTGSSYTEAAAAAQSPLGESYRQVPHRFQDRGSSRPHGLSIYFEPFTILYDGEVYLPGGEVEVEVDADDRCAVEIMLDGTTWSDSMKDAYDSPNPRTTFVVPGEGWYPIRAAFLQTFGGSWFEIGYRVAGSDRRLLDATNTRARVTESRGLLVDVFTPRAMIREVGSTAVSTVDHDFSIFEPRFDLSIPGDDFTLRYLGQLRIDEPGTYTFAADASTSGSNGGDLWRIWIDGVAITGSWAVPVSASASIDLEPGWHDFGVDFGDDSSDARIRARMSGPGIPDGPIDPARLRPAVTTGLTSTYANTQSQSGIKDATSLGASITPIDLPVDGPAGATVVSIDWGLGIANARIEDLSVQRLDCTSTGTPADVSTGNGYFYYANDVSCAGAALPLAWSYAVTDAVMGGNSGTVWNPLVAVTYRGGDKNAPFARTAVFTSTIRETPNAIGYGRVALDATLRGGTVKLEVRTGADATTIASAAWVAVADGDVPDVEPGAVLQYRVTLETGGWELVTVERVEIVYVVPE
jgi:hypothetical protein